MMFLNLSGKSLKVVSFINDFGGILLLRSFGIGADGRVGFFVDAFEVLSNNSFLDEFRELALKGLLIIVQKGLHIIGDVLTEDVLPVDVRFEFFPFRVPAGESLLTVRDIKTTVNSSFQNAKNPRPRRGPVKTHVQNGMEGFGLTSSLFDAVVLASDILLSLVHPIQTQFLEESPGKKESGAVGGGIVGKTDLYSVAGELMGVCGANDDITLNPGVSDLSSNVLVGESYNHAMFRRIVLILILDDKSLSRIVVRSSFPTPLELDLEPLEVRLVLHHLHETHF